jgi:hypothetical protein
MSDPEAPRQATVESLPPIDEENPDLEAVLAHLSTDTGVFPHAAVRVASRLRDELTPHFLALLEKDAKTIVEENPYWFHSFAIYLLALFREQRAYPLFVKHLSASPEVVDDLFGDTLTEGASRILASISGGDMEPMKRLVENPETHEYAQSAALDAMLCLVATGARTRDEVIAYLRELFTGKLEREPEHIWNALVAASMDLYPEELVEEIAAAFEEDLVDELYIHPSQLIDRLETGSKDDVVETLAKAQYRLVDDVAQEMRWWAWFEEDPSMSPAVDSRLEHTPRRRSNRKAKGKRRAAKVARKKNRR